MQALQYDMLNFLFLVDLFRSGLLNAGFGSSDYDPFSSARGGAASAEMNTDEIRNKQKQLIKGIHRNVTQFYTFNLFTCHLTLR